MTRRLLPALALVAAACGTPSPGPVPPPARTADPVAASFPVAGSAPRDARPASRTSSRLKVSKSWARGDWRRFPLRIERAAYCVAAHESINAGLWTAQNPTSSASGAFQVLSSTWRVFQERANVKPRNRTARAADAPPRRQARVFAHNWPTSKSAWFGTGCYPGSPTW